VLLQWRDGDWTILELSLDEIEESK